MRARLRRVDRHRCLVLGLALLAACQASPPHVDLDVGDAGDIAPGYVDIVVAYTEGGVPTTCSNDLPVCGGTPAMCGPTALLGAPDQVTYSLAPGDLIEVGLLCSYARERGPDTADLKLWSTFEAGASALVQVTYDGSEWLDLGEIMASDAELDLQRVGIEIVRFVRISNHGSGAIAIDAVEALR
jgi:hypothetical protein